MSLPLLSGTARLTADPELRFASSGTAICKVNLAFNARRKDESTGHWVDGDTFFITGTLFKQAAENAAESLTRGVEVVVSGRLKTRQWEQDGQKRSMPELLVDSIGPSLAFATAQVRKMDRSGGRAASGGGAGSNDPWAASAQGFDDGAPF